MQVDNSAILEAIFGRWPSFHDAEVLHVKLDRSGSEGPTLDVVIHVFEMTEEVDAKGFYVLKHHTEVTLRFNGVAELRLEAFNQQNVLSSLEIERIEQLGNQGPQFRVSMPSSYGMEAEFECQQVIVAGVRPFKPAA